VVEGTIEQLAIDAVPIVVDGLMPQLYKLRARLLAWTASR
jgi:hypothetical protein